MIPLLQSLRQGTGDRGHVTQYFFRACDRQQGTGDRRHVTQYFSRACDRGQGTGDMTEHATGDRGQGTGDTRDMSHNTPPEPLRGQATSQF